MTTSGPSRVVVALRIDARPERVFEAFTTEIDRWWRPNELFRSSRARPGVMSMEAGVGGRLLETHEGGDVDQIGTIRVWEPPRRIVITWRPTSFSAEQETEVHVRVEPVDQISRIVIEHHGWDTVPDHHVTRHGFPLLVFQHRLAEWWRDLLTSLGRHSSTPTDREE